MRSAREPRSRELRHLVLHQRDERADHQRRAAAREAGQLVAERLAGAGRHDEEDVPPRRDRPADRLLVRAEGFEAEGGAQEVVEIALTPRPPTR